MSMTAMPRLGVVLLFGMVFAGLTPIPALNKECPQITQTNTDFSLFTGENWCNHLTFSKK
jgi:hypothetical protein